MFSPRKILGLAVTEQGITAALAGLSPSRRTILKTASLPFTEEVGLGQPLSLGRELKALLAKEGMTASRCVIGLAAGWIASREKQLPPTDKESLRGVLSIAAEREFASGAGDLAFDYVASASPKGIVAMLAAAPRQVIDPLLEMAQAAGLTVTSVTSSTLATATASRGVVMAGGRLVLCLLPSGVELAVQTASGLPLLRHLSVRLQPPSADVNGLCQELGRVLSLAPPPQELGGPREVLVWDSLGVDRATLESIGRHLGLPVRICKLPGDLENLSESPASIQSRYAQAAALVASAAPAETVDFLHSRLVAPPPARFGKRTLWLGAAAAVVLVGALAMFVDYCVQNHDVSALENELATLNAPASQAKGQVEDYSFVEGWYDRRPEFLDCLKEISLAFPQDGRTWVTQMELPFKGVNEKAMGDERGEKGITVGLSIKAVNEKAAYELLDRLKASPRLINVTPMFISQSGDNKSSQVSFDVILSLKGGR